MKTPPKLPLRLLRIFCDEKYLEEVEGDLEELYAYNHEKLGARKAVRMYWGDMFTHFKAYFLKKRSINIITQNETAMWTNYLKIAGRNFWKNKVISIINTSGLSLGLTCCILIFFHINDELSHDAFLENGDNIFRVLNYRPGDETPYDAGGPPPLGPTLKTDFPGIEQSVRMWEDYQPTLSVGTNIFTEDHFIWTDADFFDMISFDLKKGNPKTALKEPNTVILTASMAKKYFGDVDPMGKHIRYKGGRGDFDLLVTGLMDDLPHNTHFKFDFLASFNSVKNQSFWGSFKPIWTYVTLKDGVDPDQIRAGFPAFAKKYVPDRVEEAPGFGFDLEPMSSIYMHSKAGRNMKPLGDLQSIYILGIIGISILLIASFNFVNLTLANSLIRYKEVGIRKIVGAEKGQLVRQFLIESGFVISISLGISFFLLAIAIPVYNDVSGKQIDFTFLLDVRFASYILLTLLATTLLAGLYPAMVLSRTKRNLVIKHTTDRASGGSGFRSMFVVFQFFVSAILIVSILVIKEQQRFIANKPLGIDKEHVLVAPYPNELSVVVQKLKEMPEVKYIGTSQRLPVNVMNYDGRGFEVEGEKFVEAQSCIIDLDFLEVYDIELVAGRNHFKEATNQWEFLINESAVKEFGFETAEIALGKKIYLEREEDLVGNVIGVFKDYHLESLHEKIPPMIMWKNIREDWAYWGRDFISIKYQTADLHAFVSNVEEIWKKHNPGRAYFSFFIDDSYNDLHEADTRFAKLFDYVTCIAVLIACMGLLGLSMLVVNQKAKEIGIRKVLGASVFGVTMMLSSRFVRMVLLGMALAIPTAYLLMDRWLDNFTYRISVGLEPIVITLVSVIFIAMLTLIFHTTRAASANPVHALKDE